MNRLIYALTDPRDGAIRYVGKTVIGLRRAEQHRKDSSLTKRGAWIRKLCNIGLTFGVIVLEQEPDDLNEAERFWIAAYRVSGRLTNMTDGGDGGTMSDEALERMKRSRAGYRPTQETKNKTSLSMKGRRPIVDNRGRSLTPEHRQKVSESNKGRAFTEAHRLKLSEAAKRRWAS